MKAIQYEIEISDSAMDYVHGFKRTIVEFYFEELNLSVNSEAAFVGKRDNIVNYKEVEIQIDSQDLKCFKEALEIKNTLFVKIVENLFQEK